MTVLISYVRFLVAIVGPTITKKMIYRYDLTGYEIKKEEVHRATIVGSVAAIL